MIFRMAKDNKLDLQIHLLMNERERRGSSWNEEVLISQLDMEASTAQWQNETLRLTRCVVMRAFEQEKDQRVR